MLSKDFLSCRTDLGLAVNSTREGSRENEHKFACEQDRVRPCVERRLRVNYEPSAAACFDLSAVLIEAVVVLASSNRSSNSRIRWVSSSGNLGSVDPICGTGGAGSKPKTSATIRMAFLKKE